MLKTLTRIIAILTAIYLWLEITYLRGLYTGYNIGAVNFGNVCYPKLSNNSCMSHADPYSDLIRFQLHISLFLILFIVGQLIKHERVSHGISFLSILVVLLGFIYVYIFKSNYLPDDDKYIDLMRLTISKDFTNIVLSAAILIYQTIYIAFHFISRKFPS